MKHLNHHRAKFSTAEQQKREISQEKRTRTTDDLFNATAAQPFVNAHRVLTGEIYQVEMPLYKGMAKLVFCLKKQMEKPRRKTTLLIARPTPILAGSGEPFRRRLKT